MTKQGDTVRARILRAIAAYWEQHGRAPSHEDIGAEVDRDARQVRWHLGVLEKQGKIEREFGRRRTVRVVQ